MTNEEWLNTLSTEEKAKFIARSCNLCSYDSDNDYCADSLNVCKKGIKEWLKKKHIERMPKIEKGDIFVYLRGQVPFFGVCVYGNIVYLPDKGECRNFGGEIKENIVTIKRYNSAKGTMEEIWGAGDDR